MSGWIKLHRKMLEWEWWDDEKTLKLFLYILLSANHRRKNWKGVTIERGQFITGIPSLQEATGLSAQSIRTGLKRLKSTGEITDQSTNRYRLITICKYDEYQDLELEDNRPSNSPANSLATGKQQASNRQVTSTKNDKNEKNDKNIIIPNKAKAKPRKRKTQFDIEKSITTEQYQKILDNPDLAAGDKSWLHNEVLKMADYYHSKGEARLDWAASLRNWLRNARGRSYQPQPNQKKSGNGANHYRKPTTAELNADLLKDIYDAE